MFKHFSSLWRRTSSWAQRTTRGAAAEIWGDILFYSLFPLGVIFGLLFNFWNFQFKNVFIGLVLGTAAGIFAPWAALAIFKHHRRHKRPTDDEHDWLEQATNDYQNRLTYDPLNHKHHINDNYYTYDNDVSGVYDQDGDN